MARVEGALNPIPILVHVVAIALGLFVGWTVMDRVTPDFPDAAPGVESSSAPRAVVGNDPDSLFLPRNLSAAMGQLQDQLEAGQGVVTLHIEPGAIDVHGSDATGTYDLADVDPATPLRIVDEIHAMRDRVSLEDIGYMDLIATPTGPRWYVQLDIARTDVKPPWTYGAPLSGESIEPGGAPPTSIGG